MALGETRLRVLTTSELLRYVDRSNGEVAELARRLETLLGMLGYDPAMDPAPITHPLRRKEVE